MAALPTLGGGLHRQLRLYDRNGVLLDATDRMPFIEQVIVDVQIAGGGAFQVQVGAAATVAFLDRLTYADETEATYNQMLADGLAERIIDDPLTGLPKLAELLSQAHDHLDILDPYFGWELIDWSVLVQVAVPTRVLAKHDMQPKAKRNVNPPPPGTAPNAPSLDVRGWPGGPPWHDRVYLWNGGGLSVGTSPSGLGKRVARLDRLTASEAAGWQQMFNSWWSDPNLVAV